MFKKTAFIFILTLVLIGIVPRTVEAKASDEPPRDFANVVLFAYFQGDDAGRAYFENPTARNKIINNVYGTAQSHSFTNYMSTISYGKFNVKNIFPQDNGTSIAALEVPVTEADAAMMNCDPAIIQELIGKIPGIQNQIVDYDGDGYIDNLTVVLHSTKEAGDTTSTTLHPHKADYPGNATWSGKRIGSYNMLNTKRMDSMSGGVGLVAHEFLHSLGYPDLYTDSATDVPVGIWDIMSKVSERPSYPLAYLRMHFTKWLNIETITSSQRLTLDKQDKAEGNQAYILKSPLNENELFVVEFRKREVNNLGSYDGIDGTILQGGVIVYRIDTTVEGLTNRVGKYGVYVFRPQNGNINLVDAALSQENGRTGLGVELGSTSTEGAITFSDGTNSGIVISNVSSSSGSQMTLDVTIPDASQFDMWTDTSFPDSVQGTVDNKQVSLVSMDNGQYAMAYQKGTYTLHQFDGTGWVQKGNSFSDTNRLSSMQLFANGKELWLATGTEPTSGALLTFRKYDFSSGNWQSIASVSRSWGGEFDVRSVRGKVYAAYVAADNKAALAMVEGSSVKTLGSYFSDFCRQPRICDINGQIYASVGNANGFIVEVFKYDGGSTFTKISDGTIVGDTYDMESAGNQLCIAVGGENLRIDTYDGAWKKGALSGLKQVEPVLAKAGGNLFMLVTPRIDVGNTQVYQYDVINQVYIKEGVDVDSVAYTMSLSASDHQLCVGYVRKMDAAIKVKTKDITDELLSIAVTPPAKRVYQKGESVDLTGFLLTAVYKSGTKTIQAGECQITGFDTNTVGKRTATVSYGGKSDVFES